MNGAFWKFRACLLAVFITGCGTTSHQDISADDNVKILQPPDTPRVQLTAHVYTDHSRSALWLSGDAKNIYGNPLIAGHVHAKLWGSKDRLVAERRFDLLQTGGTSRLHRGSRKIFDGKIDTPIPPDFRLEVAYHTQSD